MDQGSKKRKRDSSIPTLVYSAPGYNRFAKLFTETSLDEIKEIVRKRLGLSAISDFTLFYDTDISLENDDDFDAFEVHSHSSASAVNVVVKILSPSHVAPAGPSVVSQNSGPVPLDADAGGSNPPQKKRKVAADATAKPISSAPTESSVSSKAAGEGLAKPQRSRRKSNTAPIEIESISTALSAPRGASKEGERPGEEPPKKKRKKGADTTSTAPPVDTASAKQVPDTGTEERTKKKSKKVPEKDSSGQPNLPTSSTVPSTANEVPEVRTAKSKKIPEPGSEPAPPKPSTSKKSTKLTKKDKQQTEDASTTDGSAQNTVKSVKFTFPEQLASAIEDGLAQSEQATGSHQDPPPIEKDSGKVKKTTASRKKKTQNPPPSEKDSGTDIKKPKGKKKAVEQDVGSSEPPDPESLNEFWKGFRPPALIPTSEPQTVIDNRADPQAKNAKKPASVSKSHKQNDSKAPATLCPICETSPLHISYRCPVVLAGSGSIGKRIGELQQDDKADHSKLIQELRGLAQKNLKTNQAKDQNVNAHSPRLRADAKDGGVSDPSVHVPGPKVATASRRSPNADESDSSSDDSASAPLARKKLTPRPADPDMDAELEAIIRGPTSSRLTVDDIVFEEDDDAAESVVLENDEEDDVNFRRRSRQFDVGVSSGEEDDEDEEPFSDSEGAAPKTPAVVHISSSGSSRRPARSPTEPLMAIDARRSVDFDPTGDIVVGDAMASDNVMFGLETGNGDSTAPADSFVDPRNHSAQSTPTPLTPKVTPKLDPKPRPSSTRLRTPAAVEEIELLSDRSDSDIPAQREDDPIQPAEGFPPTPVQPNGVVTQPGTPTTPRMVQRMKDRNGKLAVKLSQLDLPFSLSTQIQIQPAESAQNGNLVADQAAVTPRTTTRSSTRLASAAAMPLIPSDQPTKRRRGPNKTPEQRAQEEAAKLVAKEERERARKEKAQAKAAEKTKKTVADKSPPSDVVQATPLPGDLPSVEDSVEIPTAAPSSSRTPMSHSSWTVLKPPTSPTSPQEEYRDQESMRDELHSSSPTDDGDGREAPLFLPAESQVPFPYSQWNSVPEFCPGSPKDEEDEEEEEEVAAAMTSSQRPVNASTGSYRRLTDIASQPALFSATPTLRSMGFSSATFPSAKNKRDELYGKLPQEDEDSNDSDSSAGEAPSHIPKGRRAGMITRQR